jgi:hypothetical protein
MTKTLKSFSGDELDMAAVWASHNGSNNFLTGMKL